MGILKNVILLRKGLQSLVRILKDKETQTRGMSETEILKAIENLPDKAKQEIKVKVEKPTNRFNNDFRVVQVKIPKCWSDFKYLGKPEFKGLPIVDDDPRIYFTIPCGFEWDQSIKFWFITFPLNCNIDEVNDFFTVVNPMET